MSASKFDAQALEYRARAANASVAAKACVLERAREQHELAALRWIELAEAAESRALSHRARLADAPSSPPGADHESNE